MFYLERLPCSGVIHALVDGHGVRLSVAEVQRDVGQLVLLLERDGQADVLPSIHDVGLPTGDVVGVVQVGQEVGWMGVFSLAAVAQVTLAAVCFAAEPTRMRMRTLTIVKHRKMQNLKNDLAL